MTTLDALRPGERCVIESLKCEGLLRTRLLDLGLVPGTVIEFAMRSPLGDPVSYRVRGSLIGLRSEDAKLIEVKEVQICPA